MFSLKRVGRSNSSLDTIEPGPSSDGGVLGALKAAASRHSEPNDPEYLALKTSIASLADILEAGLGHAKTVDASWARLATDQAAFAATLQNADRKSAALRDGPAACTAFSKALLACRSTLGVGAAANGGRRQNHSHTVAYEQARQYLAHLRAIQARYRDLAKARTEFEAAAAKAATARARAPRGDLATLQKAEERCASAERMYAAMLLRMTERMKAAEGRRGQAVTMLNNAFWMQQACIHSEMGSAQEPAYDAAHATEPMLVSCNLMEGLAAPSQMFTALDTRPAALSKRTPSLPAGNEDTIYMGNGRGGSGGGGGGGTGHGVRNGSHAVKEPKIKEPKIKERRYGEMTFG